MSMQTIAVRLTSPGNIRVAMIRLDNEMQPMDGPSSDWAATVRVDFSRILDVLFVCNAPAGTPWKLTLSREGEEPFMTRDGRTDSQDSGFLAETIVLG